MLILKLVRKFIKLLNSDASPQQMGAGFAFGAIIGLTPFFGLHNLFIWILIFVLKVNVSAAFLGVAVFTGLWIRNRWYWTGILFWAGLIAYSRIYLGVHFPGDVLGGAALGMLLAWGVYQIMIHIKALKLNGSLDR